MLKTWVHNALSNALIFVREKIGLEFPLMAVLITTRLGGSFTKHRDHQCFWPFLRKKIKTYKQLKVNTSGLDNFHTISWSGVGARAYSVWKITLWNRSSCSVGVEVFIIRRDVQLSFPCSLSRSYQKIKKAKGLQSSYFIIIFSSNHGQQPTGVQSSWRLMTFRNWRRERFAK